MKTMTANTRNLPFKAFINFKKVFDFWEDLAEHGDGADQARARYVLDELKEVPELREPSDDISILEKYEREIELLLSCFFPKALQANEIKAGTLPFENVFFCKTTRFANIWENAGEDASIVFKNFADEYYVAAAFVLKVLYQADINISRPMIFDLPDRRTGIMRTYRGFMNADFTELRKTERSPELTQEDIVLLLDNVYDTELWQEKVPPNSFELHGFGLLTIFDITADDALSSLKLSLIDHDALRNSDKIEKLEASLRKLFSIDDLTFGITSVEGSRLHRVGGDICQSILLNGHVSAARKSVFCDFSEGHLWREKKPMTASNLDNIPDVENSFLSVVKDVGFKSYLIYPLVDQGKIIGLIELASKKANALNSLIETRMDEIAPLFTSALIRSLTEYWNSLEAIIKEKCTAIHPTVEWRFLQAASTVYDTGRPWTEVEMEPIVFERVFPLYGQLDISGSSRFRDEGIQQDLLTQLSLAKQSLEAAISQDSLFIYQQLINTIETREQSIREKIHAGDESSILDFLKYEVEPVFLHLQSGDGETPEIDEYFSRIDPKIKMVYEGRKKYEESVNLINEKLSAFIEKTQLVAQSMFPHYFEKYKTDGVEYNLYIGDTLVEDRDFHHLHLKNLRLWQLIMTCEAEVIMRKIRDELPVPLTVASLILVQHKALDIKFRFDEKQFDVDGAYNARYEILKKRVDKARIKGGKERLTIPGKIAIVYSSEEEKREYSGYVQYLIDKNYIHAEVEQLELEELQGASGMRAMRVQVNYDRLPAEEQLNKQVEDLIQEIG